MHLSHYSIQLKENSINKMKRISKMAMAMTTLALGLSAQADTFDGGGDGTSWEDPLNWAGDAVPANNASNIVIHAEHQVSFDAGTWTYLTDNALLQSATEYRIARLLMGDSTSGAANGTHSLTLDPGADNTIRATNVNSAVISGRPGKFSTLNVVSGIINLEANRIRIGQGDEGSGIVNVSGGLLTLGRGGLELGNPNGAGDGTLNITGGSFTTTNDAEIFGSGVFHVAGSLAETIGIGSNGPTDGRWAQSAGGIFRPGLDASGVTVTFIDDIDDDGAGEQGNVTFEDGAILDPYDFGGAAPNVWTTVMQWEGTLTDNGLVMSEAALASGWQKQVVGNELQVRLTPVVPGQPVINSYEASELTVFLGETTTLLWDVSGADFIEIDQGIGMVANPAGSVDVSPTETTTYTLTAENGNGVSSREVKITVIPDPVVTSFAVSPNLIYGGETATLTWEVDNFTTIEIDQGVGVVAGPSGSVEVTPTETTTYTLTATNDNGATETTVSLTILPVPPPRELLLHWKFDEGSGTTADDSAGNNDGTFLETGGAIVRTTGILGDAVTFPNTNDTAVIALTELVDAYPFAISGWVKTIASANDTFAILGTNDGGQYHSLLVFNGGARGLARTGDFFYNNGAAVNDDSWHHVIGVFEHAASAQLYVDGVLTSERTAQAGAFVLPDRFAVGALARTDTSVVDAFDGTVDDVSFWKGIVTASEAAALSGGATGLGLNASDIAAILTGFDTQTSVQVAGVSWSYVSDLTGAAGTTGGTVGTGDGFIVLDDAGNGMLSGPSEITIIDVEQGVNSRSVIFNSNPGSVYAIEFSLDLDNWFELDDGFVATEAVSTFVDSDPGNFATTTGFYRVIFVPTVN